MTDIRVYVGQKGCGKSTLLRHHLKGEKRLIVLDPNQEADYAEGSMFADHPLQLLQAVRNPTFKVMVGVPFAGNAVQVFKDACHVAWAVQETAADGLRMVWEEIHNYRTGNVLPAEGVSIINQGRHRGIGVSVAGRRPTGLRDLTASVTHAYLFRTSEPSDLEFYRELTGDQDITKTVRELADYHYAEYVAGQGVTVRKPVRVKR